MSLHHHARSWIIDCSGELDLYAAEKLQEALDACLASDPSTIVIDGRGLRFLASSGIEVLLYAARRCLKAGVALEIELSEAARRILDIVGLSWLEARLNGAAVDEALDKLLAPATQGRGGSMTKTMGSCTG